MRNYFLVGSLLLLLPFLGISQSMISLLDENFDNNKNNWVEWDNENSAGKLITGKYRLTAKQHYNYASWCRVEKLADQSKDFAIETHIFLQPMESGTAIGSYWLLWGISGNGQRFYACGIYPDGKFEYGKQYDGRWDLISGTVRSYAIRTGTNTSNTIRVEKRKDSILFLVNSTIVFRSIYESVDPANTGVGFQVNLKKTVDIDYLKVWQGTSGAMTVSPEPHESNYNRELERANDSKSRAAALSQYFNQVYPLTDSLGFSALVRAKLRQLASIDFFAISEMLTTIKGPQVSNIIKQVMAALPDDQRKVILAYSQCVIDNYQRRQSGQAELTCPPANLPQPGYGWGKTTSSNQPVTTTTPVTVSTQPAAADPLNILQEKAKYLAGKMIYSVATKTNYFLPDQIYLHSLDDKVILTGIGSVYSYSYSAGKNVFGIRKLNTVTREVKMADIVRGIDDVSGYYLVTELGPCGRCGGSGGSWNNSSRTRSYCGHCGATGCVPTAVWNNGASRAF